MKAKISRSGFTIVELLIVIVVIGILAAITIVAYNGVTQKARIATLQSDISAAANTLEIANAQNGIYPADLTSAALKASPGTTYQYTYTSANNSYCVTGTNNNVSYYASTNSSTPQVGACFGHSSNGVAVTLTCPSGFIVVPGSSTYGTSDFCVMKYEAKQVGSSTVPISTAAGLPWVNISQTTAIANSANVAGCTGCHLISENEWLTIAQNVLSVPSNWSGGSVGSGYIYGGASDNSPSTAIGASTDDNDGYNGTGNSSTDTTVAMAMVGKSQRRTLTLTNGQVIWDLSGNAWEWTSGTIASNAQPGLSSESPGYTWKEWNNPSLLMRGLPTNTRPGNSIPAATGWTSAQGIGELCSSYLETAAQSYLRSGSAGDGVMAGVLTVNFVGGPGSTFNVVGFRVTK